MKKLNKQRIALFLNEFIKKYKGMKLALLSILICTSSVFSTEIKSQTAKVTISVTDTEISKIIDKIEDQTDYLFMYNAEKVDLDKKCSIDAQEKMVAEVLTEVFSNSDIVYAMEGTTIMLMKKEKLSKTISKTQTAQEQALIKGTVVDSKGETIVGATIQLKGTTSGVATDIDGAFSIKAEASDVLIISFIGYITKEVTVGTNKVLNITLEEDIAALEEVVIVGYGVQKKSSLTGVITVVDASDIAELPSNSLSQSLAGRAPGVNVTGNTGMAGASSTIRIRGSVEEPLFVIDNVISSKGQFDALDPVEVQNISFLKDAASASIYGSKAGNGVVLVTTRSGRKGEAKFTYKGSMSLSKPIGLQSYSATEELQWANKQAAYNGNIEPYGPDVLDYFSDKTYDVNDYIWNDPSMQQHNFSVTGGTDKIQYFMMFGYQDQAGSYRNLDFSRFNFRSNVSAQLTDRIKVGLNIAGNQRNYSRFYWPWDDRDSFTIPDFYRATFNWSRLYPFYVDDKGNPTDDMNANAVGTGSWHPVELVDKGGYLRDNIRSFTGQFKVDIDLANYVKGLTAIGMIQYDGNDNVYKEFVTNNIFYKYQGASPETPLIPTVVDPNQTQNDGLSSRQHIAQNMSFNSAYQFNWFLNYAREFGNNDVSAMLVYEQGEYFGKGINGRAEQLLSSSIDQIFVASGDTKYRSFGGSESQNARQSLIGRFNYTYGDKYIGEFSFRYDGNYKFAPGQNWGLFPSASFAWVMSREDFMADIDWLSMFKLRGSYGTSGSDGGDDVGAFQWRESFKNGDGYIFGSGLDQGLAQGTTPNPLISWSKFENYNIGFDFGFLDNKIRGEFDYFYKKESDILGSRLASVPGTFGASMSSENYAARDWRGVEFSLGWRDRIGEFDLYANANIGYAIDKWLIYDEAEGLEAWRSRIGQPDKRVFGYICDGMIATQADIDALPANFTQFGERPIPGQLLYRDIRGANYSEGADGNIDGNDQTYLSDNGSPRINYGLSLGATWKGFSIDAHFQGVGAYDRMAKTKNGDGIFQVPEKPYFELWAQGDTWTADNTDAKYPAVSGKWDARYGMAGSTFWMENGAYMRLKNLNLSYRLPQKWFSEIGVDGVQLFVNGTNLFCISAFDLYDPEQDGYDSYPLMRTFTGGLSINF